MQTNVMGSESHGCALDVLIDAGGEFWLKTAETCVPLERCHDGRGSDRPRPSNWLFWQYSDESEVVS